MYGLHNYALISIQSYIHCKVRNTYTSFVLCYALVVTCDIEQFNCDWSSQSGLQKWAKKAKS